MCSEIHCYEWQEANSVFVSLQMLSVSFRNDLHLFHELTLNSISWLPIVGQSQAAPKNSAGFTVARVMLHCILKIVTDLSGWPLRFAGWPLRSAFSSLPRLHLEQLHSGLFNFLVSVDFSKWFPALITSKTVFRQLLWFTMFNIRHCFTVMHNYKD